jgi:hypothetical protein
MKHWRGPAKVRNKGTFYHPFYSGKEMKYKNQKKGERDEGE